MSLTNITEGGVASLGITAKSGLKPVRVRSFHLASSRSHAPETVKVSRKVPLLQRGKFGRYEINTEVSVYYSPLLNPPQSPFKKGEAYDVLAFDLLMISYVLAHTHGTETSVSA